jgi:thioredoxin-dependent peroxiredoxin
MRKKISIGDKAPLFSLPAMDGIVFNLEEQIGKKNLVVYFYPKDESYGCTKEACSFRDSYQDFKDAGAEVIGISSDDEESHRKFASHYKLPFILLSDRHGKVADSYGVANRLGILKGRMTFLIDKQGIIRMIYSSNVNMQNHIDRAIEMLGTL